MNPLSDIGMPDYFWEKFQKMCSNIDGAAPECECGSGLPITVNRIPFRTAKGIVWAGDWVPGLACLACDTRRLWRVAAEATVFFGDLIEPSDAERAEWPNTTMKYVEDLEEFYDENQAPGAPGEL